MGKGILSIFIFLQSVFVYSQTTTTPDTEKKNSIPDLEPPFHLISVKISVADIQSVHFLITMTVTTTNPTILIRLSAYFL